jgi:hypothetical protein
MTFNGYKIILLIISLYFLPIFKYGVFFLPAQFFSCMLTVFEFPKKKKNTKLYLYDLLLMKNYFL